MNLDDLAGPACAWCGADIEDRRFDARHCSIACYNRAAHAERQQALRESKRGRVCAHCGGPISPDKRADARRCSSYCTFAAARRRRRG